MFHCLNPQKRLIIKIAKLTARYDFPELSATKSLPEGLIDTSDKKTNVCSDESPPLKSPVPKKLKFTSTPNKYSPSKQLCSGNVNYNDDLLQKEIEQDLWRDLHVYVELKRGRSLLHVRYVLSIVV